MAALTATIPTNAGTVTAGAAVSASDTVAQAILGPKGAYYRVTNGNASPDNITITDPGSTPAGNQLSANGGANGNKVADTITNGTAQIYFLSQAQVDPTTGLITITHSVTSSVTYELYPV